MAKLNCVSPRTLRVYDEKGILEPSERDEATGYRYYSLDQCATLDAIQLLQHLEFSLEEIKGILEHRDLDELYRELGEKEDQINRQIDELFRSKYQLNLLKTKCLVARSDIPYGQFRVEALPERYGVSVDLEKPDRLYEHRGDGASQLEQWQITVCNLKRTLMDAGLPSSYFGNVACCCTQDRLRVGKLHYTRALVFVDSRDLDLPCSYKPQVVPAGLYMARYCADLSSDEGELLETRYLREMLQRIAEQGYEVAGDYIGEVVLDTELFGYSGRDELVKMQIPIR